MRFGSLFSGIGGFDLGFERAGMECAWQCEVNEQCRSVLAHHWPDVPIHKDVTTFHATDAIRPELICGGFPCQDLSVAGRRAGLAGERSGLWYEFHRILNEFAPQWVCIENVPGLLSSNGGRDFGVVLRGLGELGYGWAYRVLDAQWFGVAQRRRRVFIVGCLGDVRRAAEVLFERESLPWDSPPSREAGARVAHCIAAGVGNRFGSGRDGQDDFVAATITAGAKTAGRRQEDDVNIVHTLRGEGFDASEDGTGRGTPIIPIDMRQASRGATMTNNRTDGGAPGTGIGEAGGPSHTICDSHVPAVAFQQVASPITAGYAKGPGVNDGPKGSPQNLFIGRMGVRRLMPIECERLQSFPDNWTRYGADGKEMSDSARYRMLGNAVCVNVATWIGTRIMQSQHRSVK